MTAQQHDARLPTGVRNLDDLLAGGVPSGSVVVVAGPPGSGKTILTQQICFHNATAERPALYFSTLSEPTAKTLRYLQPFEFFDQSKIDTAVRFVDLGGPLRAKGLAEASNAIMEHVRRVKPTIVVIDSFKVFDDLASSHEELRKFGYELAVNLMAWEATTFLLGEFGPRDVETNPLFSIVDGLVVMTQRAQGGETQRFLNVVKMRGTPHSRDEHAFVITRHGVEVYAPRVVIQRRRGAEHVPAERMRTGISKLDLLLADGIPSGSSLLVSGVAGTGKTVLLLEFVYRGALAGDKGIIFSFEETDERLRAAARGLGWELDREIERGMVEIVFVPQPDIMVEGDLLMMRERIEKLGARRVAVDSVSVFLHKLSDPHVAREKVFQLATVVQNAGAVGFFATDIPYGEQRISRFGVEETVVDGVIVLSLVEEGYERQRYLEVYKLRNTAHLQGRHNMAIGPGGVTVFPRYLALEDVPDADVTLNPGRRLATGVPGLDALLDGGVLERSVTLTSGSAGTGKTTLGLQFLLEGAARREPGLLVTLEETPAQLVQTAAGLGLPVREALDAGLLEILHLSREHVRANQFVTILADGIRRSGARRLLLDSVSQLAAEGLRMEELRQLLATLVGRFKSLGVTSFLTAEAGALFSIDAVSDHGLSAVADNVLILRYEAKGGALRPFLTVVKTRGSGHDRGLYYLESGEGGLRVGERSGRDEEPTGRRR